MFVLFFSSEPSPCALQLFICFFELALDLVPLSQHPDDCCSRFWQRLLPPVIAARVRYAARYAAVAAVVVAHAGKSRPAMMLMQCLARLHWPFEK